MQIAANSTAYGGSQAQRLLASLLQPQTSARQEQPGGTSSAKPDGPPPGAPPGPPPGGGARQFASRTLGGLLSAQESSTSTDLASQLIDAADTDGDGVLSLEEIQKSLEASSSDELSAQVAKLDTDGDGKLNADELSAGLEAARPDGPPPGGPPRGLPPSGADVASNLIGDVDADQDGALSLDEIKTELGLDATASDSLTSAFGKLDTDGDGKLGSAELTAALDAFQASHAYGRHQGGYGATQVSA